MPKTEQNLKKAEDFIRSSLEKNFKQRSFDPEQLRAAAKKLCEAVPVREKEPA
ncbi:MAG: hypothetical protein U1E59_03650 [Amaricoccus sp.]